MNHSTFALTLLTVVVLASCGNRSNENYGQYDPNYQHGNEQTYLRDDHKEYDPNGYDQENYKQFEYNNSNQGDHNDDHGQPQRQWANQQDNSVGQGKTVGVVERNTGIQMWSMNLSGSWDFNYTLDYSTSNEFPNSDWKALNKKANVTASNIRSKMYVYSSNPQMRQTFQMAQRNVAAPQSAANIQARSVSSMMQQKGYKKVSESRSGAHEQRMMKDAQAYGISGLQMTAIQANWEASDGRQAETVLFHLLMPQQAESTWWYETVIIEGGGKGFKPAAKEFNQAMVNMKQNPQWVQHTKQVIARQNVAAQQQFQANQQRINNNQRNFEATQRAIVSANNAVNESIMGTYKTQSQSSDYSQSQFVDYINEEQNVYNPNNGNTYKVESGYNQYYMNNNGEYIGTNDYNYNPNLDPNVNNQNWSNTNPY